MNLKKEIIQTSKVFIVAIALFLGVQFIFAWSEPAGGPPGSNVSTPINTSGTDQIKTGGLSTGALVVTGGASVGTQIIGGLGAMTTAGTLNWNDVSNIRSGNGYTLLMGNAANGPGPGYYFHTLNFEYSSKNGSGNITQLAIPYGSPGGGGKIYMRGSYGGVWSAWSNVASDGTFSGPIYRTAAGAGYLNGQYDGVESTGTSGAIYSIGGAYVPGTTNLGNMYGIGYGYSGNAGITATGAPVSNWGMYVAAGGVSRIFLSGTSGNIYADGTIYAGGYALCQSNGTNCPATSGVYLPLAGGVMNGGGTRIGINGSTITTGSAYGFGNGAAYYNPNSLAVDTLETDGGYGGSGTLELNYYGGGAVHIGPSGTKPLYAAIVYDGNSSGYYVDPASSSRMNQLYYVDSAYIVDVRPQYMYDWNDSAYYIDMNNSSRFHYLGRNYGWNWTEYDWNNGAYYMDLDQVSILNDLRVNILYDYQNTGYYVDPNNTSRQNRINFTSMYGVNWAPGEPRWDFSAYVVEAQHFYGHNATQMLYLGETNPVSVPGDIRTPIVYDYNNTSYYVDPNSNSRFANLHTDANLLNWPGYNGLSQAYGHYIWPGRNDGSGTSWQQSWYLASHSSYGLYTNTGLYAAGPLYTSGGLYVSGLWYDWDNTGYYLNPNSTSRLNEVQADRVYGFADIRSPIFYDYDNTGYYVDPASTTYINGLTTVGYINSPGAYFSTQICNSSCSYFWSINNGNLFANGVWATGYYSNSDITLKENVKTIPNALENILKLRGVEFNWKEGGKDDLGVIAQEVEKVYPQLISVAENNGMKSVAYSKLIGPIIEAIKELAGKIENVTASVGSILDKLTVNDRQIEMLQEEVKKQQENDDAQQKMIKELQRKVEELTGR
jgi:hypothetical protein